MKKSLDTHQDRQACIVYSFVLCSGSARRGLQYARYHVVSFETRVSTSTVPFRHWRGRFRTGKDEGNPLLGAWLREIVLILFESLGIS